ncbi:MAG: NHLP leader peptide family natural product precursor [Chloroflexi bacterium]|nr:NHLP leader peptide family natural product precursor [Chloroflexota bacterium]
MNPAQQEQAKRYGQVVAKAWQDEAFKHRLLADPRTVLEEQGVTLPAGMEVRMVENTDRVMHLTLPAKPSEVELSVEELDRMSGGGSSCVDKTFNAACTC